MGQAHGLNSQVLRARPALWLMLPLGQAAAGGFELL